MDEEIVEYIDDPSLFTRDRQARYLFKLREGYPDRIAAREIGFEPEVILNYRKENPLFEDQCQEALKEADEMIQYHMHKAASRGEPFALRSYASKWGWSDKEKGGNASINVFNGVQLEGNPIERMLAMQKQLLERPTAEIEAVAEPETPKVIDVSLDE